MKRIFQIGMSAIASLVLGLGSFANAGLVTPPAGTAPGDPYRLVFVTMGSRDATSNNIADYNTFVIDQVNLSPELSSLATTWTAIASTPSVAAYDNTNTRPSSEVGVPVFRFDGIKVADDNADLWDGDIQNAISFDQFGAAYDGFVWTGTHHFGSSSPTAPLGPPVATSNAEAGISTGSDFSWVAVNHIESTSLLPFYAISGVLTAVPEPSSMALFGLSLLLFARRRSKIS